MPTYERTTRVCPFAELFPALRDAVVKQVGADAATELATASCWETTSRKQRHGFVDWIFSALAGADPDPVHHHAAILLPTRFLFVIHGAKRGTSVFTKPPIDLQVTSPTFPVADQYGIEVIGLVPVFGHPGPTAYSIFMEAGPEAERFGAALRQIIQRAKRG